MPVRDTQFYLDSAADMVERDVELRLMQAAMDRMDALEYDLPDSLSALQWMRTYRTTAPYDALKGGTRALSQLEEQLTVEPVSVLRGMTRDYDEDSTKARNLANDWERVLQWNMRRSTKRSSVWRPDVIRSALLYDEVCQQVIYIPHQQKLAKVLGGDSVRWNNALRYGPFAVINHNPQQVHARYSDLMCEAVLLVQARTPQEIIDLWGPASAELQRRVNEDKAADTYLLCDYTDQYARCVWAVEAESEDAMDGLKADSPSVIVIVAPTETKIDGKPMGFLSWTCVMGGTNLHSEPDRQRHPLLLPIYRSELWLTANITGSLAESAVLATFANPNTVITGPDPNAVQPDFSSPGSAYRALPGTEIKKFPKEGMDPALKELMDRHDSEISRATISRVLISSEPAPGETFAGFNLRVTNAVGSLLAYKNLGERAYENTYETELRWLAATGEDLTGYGHKKDGNKRHVIRAKDVDPDSIYLSVALQPYAPIDRLQRVQAAAQMSQQLKVSYRYIYEELGITDADQMMNEYIREQFLWATVGGMAKRIQLETDGTIEQMAQQKAQQMLADMQKQQEEQAKAAQQGGGQPGQGGQPPMDPNQMGGYGQQANPQDVTGGQGLGPGAQGMNPAAGGLPPAMLNPAGATREAQTGADFSGMAGLGG